jgi:hypothetical protein
MSARQLHERHAAYADPEPEPDGPPPHASSCFKHTPPLFFRLPYCPRCRCEASGAAWLDTTHPRPSYLEMHRSEFDLATALRAKGNSYSSIARTIGRSVAFTYRLLTEHGVPEPSTPNSTTC